MEAACLAVSFGCTAIGRSHLNSTVSVHDRPPLCVINCTECNHLVILCLLHWNKRQTSKWGRCTFYKDSLLQMKIIQKFEGLDKIIILISGKQFSASEVFSGYLVKYCSPFGSPIFLSETVTFKTLVICPGSCSFIVR